MKLIITPETDGYSVQPGVSVVRTELDGGVGRYRADLLNASFKVTCQWKLDQQEYDYFMAFFRTQTVRGSLPFEIDLITDDFDLTERQVYFIPESVKLTGQKGLTYFVSATLEVKPQLNPDEATDDAAIIAAFNAAHDYEP